MTAAASPKAKSLKVAVIGLGRMGIRHVEAVRQLGMDVCAVVDRLPATMEAAQKTHGLLPAQCFTDVNEMLKVARPQAVVVATTAPTHAPFVIAAAKAHVEYILCEKPMATSLAEATAMIDACNSSGTILAINHQMMFMPQYTVVKSLIGSDELGPLSSIILAGSNFGLAMNAVHYFEMFRFISGEPVRSVKAWLDREILPNPRGAEFEDKSGRIIVRGQTGPEMYLDITSTAGHGINVIYVCRFGQIIVDELDGWMRVVARKAEHRDAPTTRYGMPYDVREQRIPPADVVGPTMDVWNAMLDGRPFPGAAIGMNALSALVAAHVSHEAGGSETPLDTGSLPRERQFKWA